MTASRALPTPADFNGIRDQIVEMYASGKSKNLIATALGLQWKEVARIINQEFNTRLGNRQQLIEKTALELEYVKNLLMDKIVVTKDRRDVEAWLKVVESKKRLFGLDAPVKVDVKYEELSDAELARELERNSIKATLILPEAVEDAEVVERVEDPEL